MKDQSRIYEITCKGKPGLQLIFDREEILRLTYYTDVISITISKEIAEKYSAQLSSALEDLDRSNEKEAK